MRNKRTVIVAFLLVAALALGIGYATLQDELAVTGSARTNVSSSEEALDADVYFTKAVISDTAAGTAEIKTPEGGTAKDKDDLVVIELLDTALKGAGDFVTISLEISNDSDLAVKVGKPTINVVNTEYFDVTTNWTADQTVAASGTADMVVTVTLKKTPTDVVETTFTLDIGVVSQ
jgi:hypothetical protein